MALANDAGCPWCTEITNGRIAFGNELAVVLDDAFPVTLGHRLIVPKKHYSNILLIPTGVIEAMWRLTVVASDSLLTGPERGVNVGINMGRAAGQTLDHVHVHVIPRLVGDVDDPRGGIRGVIPSRKVPRAAPSVGG